MLKRSSSHKIQCCSQCNIWQYVSEMCLYSWKRASLFACESSIFQIPHNKRHAIVTGMALGRYSRSWPTEFSIILITFHRSIDLDSRIVPLLGVAFTKYMMSRFLQHFQPFIFRQLRDSHTAVKIQTFPKRGKHFTAFQGGCRVVDLLLLFK